MFAPVRSCPPARIPRTRQRLRREAVWNDAMREACISGDRLYAFVRQFSGTISEQVDATAPLTRGFWCVSSNRLVSVNPIVGPCCPRAHATGEECVFSVIRESGLTLGIDKSGSDIGQLKVVSNALRKQASDLAGGSMGQDGFFANSVRQESPQQGHGEMTLEQLFEQLKDAGRAPEAADGSWRRRRDERKHHAGLLVGTTQLAAAALKPEALAAMRHAFDVFSVR